MKRASSRVPVRVGESGQGAVEYVGAMVLVLGVVGIVLLTSTDVGSALQRGVDRALCVAFNTRCGSGANAAPEGAGQPKAPPTEPCVVSSRKLSGDLSLNAEHVRGAQGVDFTLAQKSNGEWDVTVDDTSQLGVVGGFGDEAHLTLGSKQYTAGASVEGSVSGQIRSGTTWTFPDGESARDFMRHAEIAWGQHKVVDTTSHALPPGMGWLYKKGMNKVGDKLTGWSPPKPSKHTYEGGIVAEGSANAGLISPNQIIPQNASTGAELSEVTGVERTDEETTVYIKVSGGLHGRTDMLFGLGGTEEAEGEAEASVAVVFDANGNPKALRLEGGLAGSHKENPPADRRSLAERAREAYSTDTGEKTHRVFSASIDLTDPALRGAAASYLSAVGSPLLDPGRYFVDVTDAQKKLRDAVLSEGTLTTIEYEDSGNQVGAGTSVDFEVIEGGLNGRVGTTNEKVRSAKYFDGTSFVPWIDCTA